MYYVSCVGCSKDCKQQQPVLTLEDNCKNFSMVEKPQPKHSCWNCLNLNCDNVESKSCIKGQKLKFIYNINECLDWEG